MSRNKDRAEGQATLTISLPQELKDAFQAAAAERHRSASNLFVVVASQWLAGKSMSPQTARVFDADDASGSGSMPPLLAERDPAVDYGAGKGAASAKRRSPGRASERRRRC